MTSVKKVAVNNILFAYLVTILKALLKPIMFKIIKSSAKNEQSYWFYLEC